MYFYLEQRGLTCAAYSSSGLQALPHLHKHIEIVLLTEGKTRAVADSREVLMEPGDLYIAFPNQIHYYLDEPIPQLHKILIISPDICQEFRREFSNFLPVSPVLRNAAANPRIVSAIQHMIEAYAASGRYLDTKMRGNMLILLSELFEAMPLEKKSSCDTNLLTDIINYCYKNYTEDISLQSLADELHVSRFYISHLFSNRLHVNFRDYINSLRIGQAVELIRQNKQTITEIAYTVGYNSTRTFGRCFRNLEGCSPTEYQQKIALSQETIRQG